MSKKEGCSTLSMPRALATRLPILSNSCQKGQGGCKGREGCEQVRELQRLEHATSTGHALAHTLKLLRGGERGCKSWG